MPKEKSNDNSLIYEVLRTAQMSTEAIKAQRDTNVELTNGINSLVEQTKLQTASFQRLADEVEKLRTKGVRWFIIVVVLLFIAVGGATVIKQAAELGLFQYFTGAS